MLARLRRSCNARLYQPRSSRFMHSDAKTEPLKPISQFERTLLLFTRVLPTLMSDFEGLMENDVFSPNTGEREQILMQMLSSMPRYNPVHLGETLHGVKSVLPSIYEEMYRQPLRPSLDQNAANDALRTFGLEESISVLRSKKLEQAKLIAGPMDEPRDLVLDTFYVKQATVSKVEFEQVFLKEKEAQKKGYYEEELMRLSVDFKVNEHISLAYERAGEDESLRAEVQNTFSWTFESNLTFPGMIDWYISAVTPFKHKVLSVEPCNNDKEENVEESKA